MDTIRVCTYNLLNYGGTVDSTRVAAMRTIMRAVRPTILIAQEIDGIPGFTGFFFRVLDSIAPNAYDVAGQEGPDTQNALYWDSSKVQFIRPNAPIHTNLRDINEWVLVMGPKRSDTVHLFGCNLTAGDTEADSIQRAEEAALIRQRTSQLPPTRHFILAGDLNTYTSTEGAYEALTYVSRTLPGHLVDPINRPGKWHSDSTFARLHTQSTRVREFGGGVGGGLVDRFDFILISQKLADANAMPWTYTAFGNDGRHFNDSINALPNRAVPDSVAQALHLASDHLPVYLDLVFPGSSLGVEEERGKVGPMELTERRE